MTETIDLSSLQAELAGKNPRVVLRAALERFERIAVSFSGAEDVVLVDILKIICLNNYKN